MKYFFGSILFAFFVFSSGCSHKKNSPLEEVLKLAGKNRHELERVIAHYSANPADSLKLKAAEFLILNMPGKYSEYYDAPWEDVATVNLRWSSSSDKDKVVETYKIGNPVRKEDITHIKADYLISNIDLAFEVWRDKPWGRYISFGTFCEEILPYRIGTEPLENWREKVLASFADLNNAFKEDSTVTAVDACGKINDILPRFRMDKDFSNNELFCWRNNEWKSIGKKRATGQTVQFNGPHNALFYLSNNTAKKRGKVFFFLNGPPFFYN